MVVGGITLTAKETTMADPPSATYNPSQPFWKQPAFYITLLLVPLVYLVVLIVLWPGSNFSTDIKTMVVTAVVSGVLGAITGFWLASSWSSTRKDDTIANTLKEKQP